MCASVYQSAQPKEVIVKSIYLCTRHVPTRTELVLMQEASSTDTSLIARIGRDGTRPPFSSLSVCVHVCITFVQTLNHVPIKPKCTVAWCRNDHHYRYDIAIQTATWRKWPVAKEIKNARHDNILLYWQQTMRASQLHLLNKVKSHVRKPSALFAPLRINLLLRIWLLCAAHTAYELRNVISA